MIDQIVGTTDTSFVVIKLWLCGNKRFNDKLSKGITLLDLKSHLYFGGRFPQIISQLHSLCHLSLHTTDDVYKLHGNWPDFVRSFPNTLETLSIWCDEKAVYWNVNGQGHRIKTAFTRGESHAIEFETLFPRLHTLTLGGISPTRRAYAAELFPALPASLTCLNGAVELVYQCLNSSVLSLLPPGIVHLTGPINWDLGASHDSEVTRADFLDAIHRDIANAPKSLRTFALKHAGGLLPNDSSNPPIAECFLPKSILEIDLNSVNDPRWNPSIVHLMPPNLRALALGEVDSDSFALTHTNWVAELPRTLTKLKVGVRRSLDDFPSLYHHLPPNLTDLTLPCFSEYEHLPFGNWHAIADVERWPSNLTKLTLGWILPRFIANLPPALKELHLKLAWSDGGSSKLKFGPNLFPPNLTFLELEWIDESVEFLLSELPLETCILRYHPKNILNATIPTSNDMVFPTSLTKLDLDLISVRMSGLLRRSNLTEELLPNLKSLKAFAIEQACLMSLPRQLQHLDVRSIESDDGQPFKHLPPTLQTFDLHQLTPNVNILEQDFGTLSSLTALKLALNTTSEILRLLPPHLTSLELSGSISEWKKPSDLAFFPPRLKKFDTNNWSPELAKCVPLRILSSSKGVYEIAVNRVLQAAKHQ